MWPYDQQMGGFGGGWPQMQGWGGGWQMPQFQMPMQQNYGSTGYGQYQPSAGQPQQAATQEPAPNRAANQQQRMSNMQQQWGAAGTQDQGAIQSRMDNLQGRMGRQAARAAAPAPAPGLQAPAPAGGQNMYNPGAAAGSPVMSVGTQQYNTSFGNLVPTSGGNANLYKVAGQGEGPGQTYAFQNGQWGQANNSDALAQQYHTDPSGAGSGQQMDQFYRLGEDPVFKNRQQGPANPNVRRGGGRMGGY